MRHLQNFTFFLLILTLFSCERERVLPYRTVDPLLVFHSILSTDSPLEIKLEKTSNLTDPEAGQSYISQADFLIQWNEKEYIFPNLASQTPGTFTFNEITPQPGDFIKIEVKAEELEYCTTEVFFPQELRTEIIDLQVDETTNSPMVKASLELNVPEEELAYFIVYAEGMIQNEQSGEIEARRFRVSSKSTLIDDRLEGEKSEASNLIFIADARITNKIVDLSIEGIPSSFQSNPPKESIHLVVEQLSQDLFEYYLTLELANTFDPDRTVQEPITIHSNIDGGIGIFGITHTTRHNVHW